MSKSTCSKKKTIKECKTFRMEEWTAQVPPTSACYRHCRTQDTACYFYPKKSCFSRNSVSFVLQHLLLLKGRVYINRLTWTVHKSGLFLLCFGFALKGANTFQWYQSKWTLSCALKFQIIISMIWSLVILIIIFF